MYTDRAGAQICCEPKGRRDRKLDRTRRRAEAILNGPRREWSALRAGNIDGGRWWLPLRTASARFEPQPPHQSSAARTGAVLARLHDRAGRADDAQSLPCPIRSDRGSGQDAIPDTSAHAAAWLRLRPG